MPCFTELWWFIFSTVRVTKINIFSFAVGTCKCIVVAVVIQKGQYCTHQLYQKEKEQQSNKIMDFNGRSSKESNFVSFFLLFQANQMATMLHLLVLVHLQSETMVSLYHWLCWRLWQCHRWLFFVNLTHSLPCCWKNVATCGPEHLHMWSEYLNGKCTPRVFKEKACSAQEDLKSLCRRWSVKEGT